MTESGRPSWVPDALEGIGPVGHAAERPGVLLSFHFPHVWDECVRFGWDVRCDVSHMSDGHGKI